MKKRLFVILVLTLLLSLVCAAATETEEQAEKADNGTQSGLEATVILKGDLFIDSGEFSVSLNVRGTSLRGCSASLVFNKSKLTPVSVTYAEDNGVNVYHSVSDGRIKLVFYTDDVFTGEMTAADIRFAVKDGKQHEIIRVNITDAVISDGKDEKTPLKQDYSVMLLTEIHGGETETDSGTETDTETETETATDAETEKTPATEETEQTSDTDTQTDRDTETDTDTETQTETDTETDTAHLTETEENTDDTGTETDAQSSPSGEKGKNTPALPVIIILICASSAGAAVGAVFLVKHLIKAKKP